MSVIKVNGKELNIDQQSASIFELIKLKNVEQPEMVSVQLNGKFVERYNFDTTFAKDGDEVEFLYFMGGGSQNNKQIFQSK